MGDRERVGEEIRKEGFNRSPESGNADDTYLKARRIWKDYMAGKITASELDKLINYGDIKPSRKETIGDLYGKDQC